MQALLGTPTSVTSSSLRDDRAAWWLVGFGLLGAAWFAYYPLPFLSFYKEWIFAAAFAMAALALRPHAAGRRPLRHPLVYGSAAVLLALLLQALLREGLWPRAILMAAYVGFFVFALALGQHMHRRRGSESLLWLSGFVLAAALGSCLFGALQLNWIEFNAPLVAPRPGTHRVSANLAQANHFADLLWMGCFAAAYLLARRRLGVPVFVLVVATLLFFSHFTGSRTPWIYAALAGSIGGLLRWRSADAEVKRLSAAMLGVAALLVLVTASMSATRVQEVFGIAAGAQRADGGQVAESNNLRLWFYRVGVDAVRQEPLLGVGVGRYVGHAHQLTMSVAEGPAKGADANAHNVFLHLAAEVGTPAALVLAACVGWWLLAAGRRSVRDVHALGALLLCGPILVHANLEYPLWYAYFLGLLGLLAGHVPWRDPAAGDPPVTPGRGLGIRLAAPLAVLAAVTIAYLHFGRLESAMQRVVIQANYGAAPQADEGLVADLAGLPSWSPYRDYAESILLMTALPTRDNAADLAARCDRAVAFGPAPYLLARCATIFQVAGQPRRASYFADSICKIYPGSDLVLIQSMEHVGRTRPEALDIASTCIERRP
jgi:hypothetical protein